MGQVSADESLACREVADKLPIYLAACGAFRDAVRKEARSRSPVGRALAKRSTGWSDDQVAIKAVVAEDHLRCVGQVIATGDLPVTSLFSLLRTAVEADAQAVWLLAAAEPHGERLRRRLIETAFGVDGFLKVGATGLGEVTRRLARRGEKAGMLGRWRARNPGHRLAANKAVGIIADRREKLTTQVERLFGARRTESNMPLGLYLYRVLSGWTHADVMPLIRGAAINSSGGPGHTAATLTVDIETLLACCSAAVGAHELMMADYLRVCGLDPAKWQEAREPLSPFLRPSWMEPGT